MDKCPKCGAEVRRNTYPFSSSMVPAKEWLCGTYDKWMNGVCVGTNQSEQCLRNQLATVTAERDKLKATDNPEWDCTDCAHPAWWRGHEHTAKSMCQLINEILDGEDDGRGVANEPWESTRQSIRKLAAERDAAEARVRELEGERQSFAIKFASNLATIALEATVHAFDHPECYPTLTELRGCLGPSWSPPPRYERTDDMGDC